MSANLYVQVCKLFIDLQVIFRHFPWWSIVNGLLAAVQSLAKKISL